jgi:hypothetical protein
MLSLKSVQSITQHGIIVNSKQICAHTRLVKTNLCLVDAPHRLAVENQHAKFGMKCEWITQVKMTSEYDISEKADA